MIIENLDELLPSVGKPARYTGGEWNSVVKDWEKTPIRIALAFPDTYEIGMSNLAIPILYKILNDMPDVLCERVYAPWTDMEEAMRSRGIPLFSLETRHALADFDIIGFSLDYELGYTTMLNMLDLAGLPVLSARRDGGHPLIIAGGSCALNPEPPSAFIDLFTVGEGEEILPALIKAFRSHGKDREVFLRKAATLPGIYVPCFYSTTYNEDGSLAGLTPTMPEAKKKIKRQVLAQMPAPVTDPVVPYIEIVHDRAAIEIQRGCTRGCRFCQAGAIYRPVRELSHTDVLESTEKLLDNTGYSELSLVSLSTGDYHNIYSLIKELSARYGRRRLSISLPSLRLDTSSIELIESLPSKRKTTLTFAPEAGSERLRYAINKDIPDEVIMETLAVAFSKGWMNLKLYFMVGLPTETEADVHAIVDLVKRIRRLGKQVSQRPPRLRVSVSALVPKPHTPCQWLAQDTPEQLERKFAILKEGMPSGVHLSWHDPQISRLEAVMARGDRRIGAVIYEAWRSGCKFDTWSEHLDHVKWLAAFKACGIDPAFYASRLRALDETLPWQHIDIGVSRTYLKNEYRNIERGRTTPDCRTGPCNACGLQAAHPVCREKCSGHQPQGKAA